MIWGLVFFYAGHTANGIKDGTSHVVNGDLSSHSSVASNNGTTSNNSVLLSGRKRRPSSWSRGYISKPKRKKVMDQDSCTEKQDVLVRKLSASAQNSGVPHLVLSI